MNLRQRLVIVQCDSDDRARWEGGSRAPLAGGSDNNSRAGPTKKRAPAAPAGPPKTRSAPGQGGVPDCGFLKLTGVPRNRQDGGRL